MSKSKLFDIKESNITLKNCPPNAKIKVYYEVIEKQDDSMRNTKNDRMTLSKLAEEMRAGFKQVNARIDKIDARLDYIVEANNLKDRK